MILLKRANALREYLSGKQANGNTIGFVPTMGALHQGHISLIQAARKGNSITVCSIFVNPTQFNDPSDFQRYPVTLEKDIQLLEKEGVDILFLPYVDEIYPDGLKNLPSYDLGYLETILEGKYRPGHFQGVCQVMHRLLTLVTCDDLYMGQKDYQQCMVVSKLLQLTGIKTRLHTCPTLREPDGLAMSSRNMRLSPETRHQAVCISTALQTIKNHIKPGDTAHHCREAEQFLQENGFKVDYVAIADAAELRLISQWDGNLPLVALAAAYLNDVRLIDNMLIPTVQ
ncbi:pantoate--beta-alanine ligase [Flavihumibacter petaseus]|uniref:Pantothenate synthetase n=1 Tax=Flavihumibacter petaseus NBRC 106054 TaxID=1220578 RepID=A0A0E9N3T7_9BACT|nr:pantoate--beta-alanine ligase [Flavihumibacter petaseus]GAO44479.1 pantothenate synthetase [Flavihumibacter petaseus NBRC 106054]